MVTAVCVMMQVSDALWQFLLESLCLEKLFEIDH